WPTMDDRPKPKSRTQKNLSTSSTAFPSSPPKTPFESSLDSLTIQTRLDDLPPEIFSLILRSLNGRERLNLRECNRSLEDRIAATDLRCEIMSIEESGQYIEWKWGNQSEQLNISGRHATNDEILHLRRRLFDHGRIKEVTLSFDHYERKSMAQFVKDLLQECTFDNFIYKIRKGQFTGRSRDLIKKYESTHAKMHIHMDGF
ncbi:hypothetical protein PFISCL1PPCAC_2945, partial [Pristionchus fissidentatus]